MNPIKEVVNNYEWQSLRKSFLGTWKTQRKMNCLILSEYLGDFSDPLKVRRVHNYLTGSGFRIGIISGVEIDNLLKQLRNVDRSSQKCL